MIIINNEIFDIGTIIGEYPDGSVERMILERLSADDGRFRYESPDELRFELRLRGEIVNASYALYRSDFSFRVFRDSYCNPAYWNRMNDGGFSLREDVKPSDAIRDIFINGSLYANECATGMVILYYKALLEVFPEDAFNSIFTNIVLMNWQQLHREIREVGRIRRAEVYLPGDRRYFDNPDVDPLTPEWQGENVIDLGNGLFYGHGIGIYRADVFINALNKRRREGSERSAYLMDNVGYPNFKRLFDLYERYTTPRQ